MLRWQTPAGIALGFGIAVVIAAAVARNPGPLDISSGAILSESDGHLRELVIQYEPSARDVVLPAYRDFLPYLEEDITVHVVSPTLAAFDELVASVGAVRCKLRPIVVSHAMTSWARDRWLALGPGAPGITTLWSPRGEAAAAIWPERTGDQQIGFDIAKALGPGTHAKRSSLYFDGGDFLADNDAVFVMPRVLQRNIQKTVNDRSELSKVFSEELKRRVVVLREAPDHHAAMFMVSVGNKTMLVGDPALARQYLPPAAAAELLPGGADFTPETQRLFDAVARESEAEGYRVVRVPVVPAMDGRTFLTYVNSIIDRQGERRIVYLPIYQGAEPLNRAARKVWEDLGYEVRPVDSTSTYRHYGALHCLVNVLSRGWAMISTNGPHRHNS